MVLEADVRSSLTRMMLIVAQMHNSILLCSRSYRLLTSIEGARASELEGVGQVLSCLLTPDNGNHRIVGRAL
jgi:hypothetical protein